jgi:NADP-dependent 3-hydroxy acid dehydrogenase YdfG
MQEQKSGQFVNISSLAGHRVLPTGAVYSGTKFAVRAISEGLRQEVSPDIRVTLISPGVVESELGETTSDAQTRKMIEEFRAIAIPADAIARAIVFAIEQPANVDVSEMIVQPTGEK